MQRRTPEGTRRPAGPVAINSSARVIQDTGESPLVVLATAVGYITLCDSLQFVNSKCVGGEWMGDSAGRLKGGDGFAARPKGRGEGFGH